MYCWLFRLYIYGVHEFYIEQQIEIILNSFLEEWNPVQQSLKDRLSSLDFNSFVDEMLLERERLYTAIGIQRTSHSTRHLDLIAKSVPWFDMYEPGGHEDVDVDDIIGDPNYVPTK